MNSEVTKSKHEKKSGRLPEDRQPKNKTLAPLAFKKLVQASFKRISDNCHN